MSSKMSTTFPSTEPPIRWAWVVFSALLRRLSTMANVASSRLACPKARLILPSSGDTGCDSLTANDEHPLDERPQQKNLEEQQDRLSQVS